MHEMTSRPGLVCEDCAEGMISVRCPECKKDNDFFGKCNDDVLDCENCDDAIDWMGEKVPEEKKRKRDYDREARSEAGRPAREAAKRQADAQRVLLKADAELLAGIKSQAQSSVLKALVEGFLNKHG
jgi:hypothetical protein